MAKSLGEGPGRKPSPKKATGLRANCESIWSFFFLRAFRVWFVGLVWYGSARAELACCVGCCVGGGSVHHSRLLLQILKKSSARSKMLTVDEDVSSPLGRSRGTRPDRGQLRFKRGSSGRWDGRDVEDKRKEGKGRATGASVSGPITNHPSRAVQARWGTLGCARGTLWQRFGDRPGL